MRLRECLHVGTAAGPAPPSGSPDSVPGSSLPVVFPLYLLCLFPWPVHAFILDLTFKFFQCVIRDLPRAMACPWEVCVMI